MTRTVCRRPDCGAAAAGAYLCRVDAAELGRALRNPRQGDPDIPTLMSAVSQAATGQARVYRAMRRPGEPDEELAELEHEHAAYTAITAPMLRSKEGRITLPSTRNAVDLHARDLLDEAWNEITTTVRDLIEKRGRTLSEFPALAAATPPSVDVRVYVIDNRWRITRESRIGSPAQRLDPRTVCDWLADNVHAIRYDETAADIHQALTALRERLLRAVDRGPSRVYAGPCDGTTADGGRCGRPVWARFNPFRAHNDLTDDDEHADFDDQRMIVCDGYRPPLDPKWDPTDEGCGAEFTTQDRHAWLIADLADRNHTIDYWATWLPQIPGIASEKVPASVIRSWAGENHNGTSPKPTRARLLPHGLDRDANELFRGGDVMDLMAQYRPKRYAPRPNRGRLSA